jgi:hypothetical protein
LSSLACDDYPPVNHSYPSWDNASKEDCSWGEKKKQYGDSLASSSSSLPDLVALSDSDMAEGSASSNNLWDRIVRWSHTSPSHVASPSDLGSEVELSIVGINKAAFAMKLSSIVANDGPSSSDTPPKCGHVKSM